MEAVRAVGTLAGAIDFARLGGDLFVQPDGQGGERILLRHEGVHLRADVISGTVLDGPVVPRILLTGIADLSAPMLTLRRLGGLSRHRCLAVLDQPRERRAGRWVQMLRVLDAITAGASQRDIAIVLFGRDTVAAEWRGVSDHLRLKVQRLAREARRLAGGGYRSILKGIDPR